MTAIVTGRDRGRVRSDAEVVRPVVFDEERAVLAHDLEHGIAQLGRPLAAGRIDEVRLCLERARPSLPESAVEVVRIRAIRPRRDGDELHADLRSGEHRFSCRRFRRWRSAVMQLRVYPRRFLVWYDPHPPWQSCNGTKHSRAGCATLGVVGISRKKRWRSQPASMSPHTGGWSANHGKGSPWQAPDLKL